MKKRICCTLALGLILTFPLSTKTSEKNPVETTNSFTIPINPLKSGFGSFALGLGFGLLAKRHPFFAIPTLLIGGAINSASEDEGKKRVDEGIKYIREANNVNEVLVGVGKTLSGLSLFAERGLHLARTKLEAINKEQREKETKDPAAQPTPPPSGEGGQAENDGTPPLEKE